MEPRLEFFTDPRDFLREARGFLGRDPVVSNVVATIADRHARVADAGESLPEDAWWLVVRNGDSTVVGAGMRTANFPPRPLFLLPMPDVAAQALAHALHDRGESGYGVNGALPAVQVCADEAARLAGTTARVAQHTRLWELTEVIRPRRVPGRLRVAEDEDVELARDWFNRFMADADEQAGRAPGSSPHEVLDHDDIRRKIALGCLWFWVDEDDRPVHLSGANPPSLGVSRIGPVYTPREQRGRGYAAAAVAAISQMVLDAGARPCLFTDQNNPSSNAIYEAIGYRPLVEMANLLVG
jgi:GNAT superfamily N-acetyltransferase